MRIWALQRPDLNRLQKTDLNICPPARKSVTSTQEKQSLNVHHEKIAKPNGFFSPKIEERRILSSRRNKGRAVTSPSPGIRTYHYHLQKPERSRFHCQWSIRLSAECKGGRLINIHDWYSKHGIAGKYGEISTLKLTNTQYKHLKQRHSPFG
jgi:hypothetical protein